MECSALSKGVDIAERKEVKIPTKKPTAKDNHRTNEVGGLLNIQNAVSIRHLKGTKQHMTKQYYSPTSQAKLNY